jgi:hypothetical protein
MKIPRGLAVLRSAAVIMALAMLAWASSAVVSAQTSEPAAPVPVTVHARSIESFDLRDRTHRRFGKLEFRSGLILTSSFRKFGGLSAFRLDPKGETFVAVSDRGDWFTGRLVYQEKIVTGLADVVSAPLLGSDGRPIEVKKWFDSESLAFDGTTAYVGIERANRILRYDFRKDGILAQGEEIAVPPAFRKLPFNKGPEGMVVIPKGQPLQDTLIVFSERALDSSGNLIGFLIGGPKPGQFAIRRSSGYDISDVALLPGGDLLVLERKFSWAEGVGIRIRRVPFRSVAPSAVIDGAVIFEVDLGYEIDNMEALDVHRDSEGNTVLTMVSDDNFSILQRTLLLQFTLIDE